MSTSTVPATSDHECRDSEPGWAGLRRGPLDGPDRRPRLHPAQLHALRGRRRVPGRTDRAHDARCGRS